MVAWNIIVEKKLHTCHGYILDYINAMQLSYKVRKPSPYVPLRLTCGALLLLVIYL